jgi:ABC-type transporter Mla subunit MlaD
MTSSQTTPSSPLTDAQITEILAKMDVLVELVAPLKALLAGAAGMTGGAGQRLEELIQQLTSVSAGLHQNVEDLTRVFGPTGTLMQMEQRMQGIEDAMQQLAEGQAETTAQVRQISAWMSGAA